MMGRGASIFLELLNGLAGPLKGELRGRAFADGRCRWSAR